MDPLKIKSSIRALALRCVRGTLEDMFGDPQESAVPRLGNTALNKMLWESSRYIDLYFLLFNPFYNQADSNTFFNCLPFKTRILLQLISYHDHCSTEHLERILFQIVC